MFLGPRSVIRKSHSLLYCPTWSCNNVKYVITPALLLEPLILYSKRFCYRHWSGSLVHAAYCLLMKSPIALLLSIAQTCSLLIWVWILKWSAPGTISLIRHEDADWYIFDNSRVESTLGNIEVESWKTDIGGSSITTISFCAMQQHETESLQVLLMGIVLLFKVLYDMLVLLNESADVNTVTLMSELNLFRLSIQRSENLLK